MMQRHPDDSPADRQVAELLDIDRELTSTEKDILHRYSETVWGSLTQAVGVKARSAYTVSEQVDFNNCLTHHLDSMQMIVMVAADVYHCPECGRLLKDRRTPVASALLLERRRLAGMLAEADAAPPDTPERARLWQRLRTAVGL